MKPSRKILGIRLRNFDSGISKEMNWVGAILDYLDEQDQETKASGDCRFCPTKNGVHIHPCIKDVECQKCGLPYDAHTQILDHGFKAKPQEEPKEEAIRYLKLILPMAKGYAAKNDAGSNQAYIEEVERFIKSQE